MKFLAWTIRCCYGIVLTSAFLPSSLRRTTHNVMTSPHSFPLRMTSQVPPPSSSKATPHELSQGNILLTSSSTNTDTLSKANATPHSTTTIMEMDTTELSETQKLMNKVKDAGTAGVISYALWELGFWLVSVPVVLFGYYEVTGHFPNLSDPDDLTKLGAEAFAFVNFARFALPLRIGLALSTTPWIEANVVERFMKKSN